MVGIARDAKYARLDEATPPFVYFPLAQVWQPSQTLLVRTAGDPERLAAAVQQAVLSIDPFLPRARMATHAAGDRDRAAAPARRRDRHRRARAASASLLAAVGLYGLMSFSASRRTREIGIRVALGAARSQVLGMMVRDGMRLAAIGIASACCFPSPPRVSSRAGCSTSAHSTARRSPAWPCSSSAWPSSRAICRRVVPPRRIRFQPSGRIKGGLP